jgi:hypothetical protein
VEQESKRRGPAIHTKFPSLSDLADLSEVQVVHAHSDFAAFAKKQYWCLDKDWAARRQSLLLDALSVCGSTQNESGPAGERCA